MNKKENNIKDLKETKKALKKPKNSESEDIKRNIEFNLLEVVIIILITGIVVSIVSGIIVYKNYDKLNTTNYTNTISDDELSEFEENYNKIINNYVEEVDKEALLDAAIEGMYNYLGDDYSTYISKDDTNSLEDELTGEYTGIGVEIMSISSDDGNITTITKVFEDSPAEKAGLKVGDILLELDGESLSSKDSLYISNTIKYGEKDTYELKVSRNDEEITVSLTRSNVYINSVSSEVLEDNIGYIKIETFSATALEQVKEKLDSFDESITSLIIDLRDNTGGYLSSAYDVSSLFLEKGKCIYQIKDKNGNITKYNNESDIYRKFDKIVVIINGNSASAAEILTLALKESTSATIVGTKSFGKGTVQETSILDSGAMVKYTTSYWLSPNGNSINEVGIEPDIEETNEDNQLITAIKAVK